MKPLSLQARNYRRTFRIAFSALWLSAAIPHGAAETIASLTSSGANGSFNLQSLAGYGNTWFFNTSNGQLSEGGLPYLGYPARAIFTPQVFAQANGPGIDVFNFSAFDIPLGFTVTAFGSSPAAILTTGSVTIAGDLIVESGAAAGGLTTPTRGGGGGLGGAAGQGGGFYFGYNSSSFCCTVFATNGSGGGGGMVSQGQSGASGVPQYYPGTTLVQEAGGAGGAKTSDLSILQGGGGGGGAGFGFGGGGGAGGAGGGALLLETPDNLTITGTGEVQADGMDGTTGAEEDLTGSGGGGGGGDLWFNVGGGLINDGLVAAQGGAGGVGCCETLYSTVTGTYWGPSSAGGAGSGGYIDLDSAGSIVNNGIIDVSGGNGGSAFGGLVNTNGDAITGTGEIQGDIAPEPGTWLMLAFAVAGLAVLGSGRVRTHRWALNFVFLSIGLSEAIPHAAAGPIVFTLTGYLQASTAGQQFNSSFTWTVNADNSSINTLSPGVLATAAVSSSITFPALGTLPLANVVVELNASTGQITFGNPFSGGINFTSAALKTYGLTAPFATVTGANSLVAGTITGTDGTVINLTGVANLNNGPSPAFQAALPAPAISSVTNAASNIVPGLPNSAIAQGAIFLLFGSGMGPQNLAIAAAPFQSANVSGSSVAVTVNGTTVNAPMYYASDSQVSALLPSNTPTGTGTVTVTYNGVTGAPAPITVAANNIGIFTVGSNGQGPAIVTYADYSLVSAAKAANCGGPNTTCGAANPGDTLILWATGLGPVTGADASGAGLGLNMPNIPLTVWLGGVQAAVSYQGRSGCCIGEDQIVFTVPNNAPTGCAVPLVVQIDNMIGNYTSMPVASGSRSCTPANPALSQVNIEQKVAAGPLNYGSITLSKNAAGPQSGDTDGATIQFVKILSYGAGSQPFYATYLDTPPAGSCTVYNTLNPSTKPPIAASAAADAGTSFIVMGPNGNQVVAASSSGQSSAVLSAAGTYLTPGAYTVTGTGGGDVGPFTATATMPPAPILNTPSLSTRSAGTTVTWSGGAANALIEIQIKAATDNTGTNGATAVCYAVASSGTIAIPSYVTLALPPTNFGTLQLQQWTLGPFTATGLGIGEIQTGSAPSIVNFTSH